MGWSGAAAGAIAAAGASKGGAAARAAAEGTEAAAEAAIRTAAAGKVAAFEAAAAPAAAASGFATGAAKTAATGAASTGLAGTAVKVALGAAAAAGGVYAGAAYLRSMHRRFWKQVGQHGIEFKASLEQQLEAEKPWNGPAWANRDDMKGLSYEQRRRAWIKYWLGDNAATHLYVPQTRFVDVEGYDENLRY